MKRISFVGLIVLDVSACRSVPPEIEVTITPEAPTVATPLNAVVTPENQWEVEFRWFLDGEEVTDISGASVPTSKIRKGQGWQVIALPFDGDREGPPVTDFTTILNTPPSVVVSILPENPGVGEALEAVTTTMDLDGDNITLEYAWFLNGERTEFATAKVPAYQTAEGQVWTVEVVPKDPEERGESAFATVTIGPPRITIDSVEFTPDPVLTDSVLQAWVSATDFTGMGGLTFTYAWFVDGELQDVDSTSNTLDGTLYFDKGQSVGVEVVASNGVYMSEPFRSPDVVVLNTPPTSPVVDIRTEYSGSERSLVCEIVEPSTDADTDPISYSFSWTFNGSVIDSSWLGQTFYPEDTVLASVVCAGEWACTVTPSDGTDTGPGTTAIETVAPTNSG